MRPHRGLLVVLIWWSILPAVSADESAAIRLVEQRLGPEFRQCFVPVEGGILSCYRRSGAGPTLLLMPGTFSDSRNYALTVQALDANYDLLILENRGIGGSWPPPETSSIEECATDAISVLDALRVEKCFVGGHSLGGMIALELGRRIPERVRGVISIEGWTNSQAAKDAFQGDMKSTLSEEQLAEMERYRADVLRLWTAEQRSGFGSIWKKWNGAEFLQRTSLPVLELYGDRNKPRPAQEVLGIPQRDNIEFVWFGGASHSLLVERPAEVAAEINRFVAAH
jgi:pimeloyl-ACP methyl ester carboxylesterase